MEKQKALFSNFSNILKKHLFFTELIEKCMYLLHSLFHCLAHIQFSSLLVRVADPPHSWGLDTAGRPSAARTPPHHSAGSGCTATQQTGVKLPTAKKKNNPTSLEFASIPHIESAVLRAYVLSSAYLTNGSNCVDH